MSRSYRPVASCGPTSRCCHAPHFSPKHEQVKPNDAPGRVSAEMVTPYPPGIPALAPGEVITEAIVDYLEEIVAAGAFLEGAADQSLDRFGAVAD